MSSVSRFSIAFVVCCGLPLAACSKSEPAPAPVQAPAPAAPAAPQPTAAAETPQSVFQTRCIMCHGNSGKGDGPASAALNPKPRDYTNAEWQKSVTDDQIKKTITGGGASVGKSPLMPAQPDLASKPEVLDGLVKIIRSFAAT